MGERWTSVSSVLSGQWLTLDDDVLVVSNVEDGILELYAPDGRRIFTRSLKTGTYEIPLTEYKGIYLVVLRDTHGVRSRKICLK